jgi:hypothetical protein
MIDCKAHLPLDSPLRVLRFRVQIPSILRVSGLPMFHSTDMTRLIVEPLQLLTKKAMLVPSSPGMHHISELVRMWTIANDVRLLQ